MGLIKEQCLLQSLLGAPACSTHQRETGVDLLLCGEHPAQPMKFYLVTVMWIYNINQNVNL